MRTLQFSLLISLAFLSSTPIQAAPNPLLRCLAQEEALLHKEKDQSILYRLNQSLINELASTNDISLKEKFVNEICQSKQLSPSVGLLRLLLLKEGDIYDLSFTEVEASMRPFKKGYVEEFQKQIPHLFIQYISGLEAEMPTYDCLTKAIPELAFFNERLKYLEEELSIHDVINNKSKIEAIFTKLQDLKAIKKKCEQEAALKKATKKPSPTSFNDHLNDHSHDQMKNK